MAFGEFLAFDDGERRLELRRMGPAHTVGDAVAYLPHEGILFTGDLCVNWKSGNNMGDRDADPQNWVRASERAGRLERKDRHTGTWQSRNSGNVAAQSAFIDDVWKQVSTGKRAGKTAEQLTREVSLAAARRLRRRRSAKRGGHPRRLRQGAGLVPSPRGTAKNKFSWQAKAPAPSSRHSFPFGRSVTGLGPRPGNGLFLPPAASPSNRASRLGYA